MNHILIFAGFFFSSLVFGVAAAADDLEPIKVGVSMAQTGEYAQYGKEELKGIQMWVDDINERGALLGRPVKLVYYDDTSDEETSAKIYSKLILEDKVDLLISPYSSGLALAASVVAEKYNFPMMITAAAPKIWERGFKNVFGVYTPADLYMDRVLQLAKEKGLKRVNIIYADAAFPESVAKGAKARAIKHGMEVILYESYDRNNREFADLVGRMVKTQPELVIVGSYLEDAAAILLQAKASNLSPKIFAFSGGPALLKFGQMVGKENAEGVISSAQWVRDQRMPGAYDFSYRFKKKYGRNASYYAAAGYAAGQILEAAVRLAESINKTKVRNQLAKLKFRSLFGHYRVDKTGKQIGKPMYVLQWQQGRRRLIYPSNLADFSVLYPYHELAPWGTRTNSPNSQ